MTNVLYDVYRKEVFRLAKTTVIKHNGIATAMNTYLTLRGFTVETNPETWRYYKHIAGEYHEFDKPMHIINLDDVNSGEVLLTKELLENNRITREAYQYGSRFYKELVNRFPQQESLLLGMLNPVHINNAINATDGSILYYDKFLVEEYELYFIEDLEKWIKNYLARWLVKDYIVYNDRYLVTVLGDIYSKLPGKIMQIRLNYCHTDYVHSYHIKQFLDSNLYLGKYVPYMSRRTMMFLYRNIRWILRNVGKKHVFDLLVDRILTEQNIPLTEHHLIRTVGLASDIIEGDNYPNDPYPDIKVLPRSINFPQLNDTASFIDVRTIINKEGDLLGYTEKQITEFTAETVAVMKSNSHNEVPTKVLESVMVDNTNSVYFPLGKVLASHWVYYACSGKYNANVSFVNPVTNEQVVLSALDALVLYCYLLYTGLSDTLTPPTYIDKFAATAVFRLPSPTRNDILNVIVKDKVSVTKLNSITNHRIYMPVLNNNTAFYDHCLEIQQFMMHQRRVWASSSNMAEHAMLINAATMHYTSYDLDPFNTSGNDVLYSEWLADKGLVFENLERAAYLKLASTIAGTATGSGSTTSRTIQEMHAAMISLMEQLSSYSIQYLRSITSAARIPVDWYFLRTDNIRITESGNQWVDVPDIMVTHYDSKMRYHHDIDVYNGVRENVTFKASINFKYSEKLNVRKKSDSLIKQYINIPHYAIREDYSIIDLATLPNTSVTEYTPL